MLTVVSFVVAIVRFLLELAMLAAFIAAGAMLIDGPLGVVVGVALALVAALVWGMLVAPKASRRLPPSKRVVVEIVLFGLAAGGLAAGGLAAAGQEILGVVLALIYALDAVALYGFGLDIEKSEVLR